MVKLKSLILLLAIHAAFSANNDTKTQKKISQKSILENKTILKKLSQNLTAANFTIQNKIKQETISSNNKTKLRKNIIFRKAFFQLSLKNDTKKRVNKLSRAKNSLEVYKLRQNRKNRTSKLKNVSLKRYLPVNCKKLKCPAVERPVCAKLLFTNTSKRKNKPFHVIMINKCEINYAKCHRGLEATIVPMKNCHSTFINTTSKTTKTGKKRSKREVQPETTAEDLIKPDEPKIEGEVEMDTDDANLHANENVGFAGAELEQDNEQNIEGIIEIDNVNANQHPNENVDLTDPEPAQYNEPNIEGVIETDTTNTKHQLEGSIKINEKPSASKLEGTVEATDAEDVAKNEVEKKKQRLQGGMQEDYGSPEDTGIHYDDNADTSEFVDPNTPDYKYEPNPAPIVALSVENTGNTKEESVEQETTKQETVEQETESPVGDNDSINVDDDNFNESLNTQSKAKNEHFGDEQVNQEEYKADCPNMCPATAVMVCAMCDHGIYKTFPSVCHLRMFQCKHKDKKLHLVTRSPCIMSAPYLLDAPPSELQGRVEEPDDFDVVLRFIRCREKGKLDTDPRCTIKGKNIRDQAEKPDKNLTTEY